MSLVLLIIGVSLTLRSVICLTQNESIFLGKRAFSLTRAINVTLVHLAPTNESMANLNFRYNTSETNDL